MQPESRTRRAGVRAAAAAAVAVLALVLALPAARGASANRIIARVNDRIATLYDFEVRLEESLRRAEDVPEDLSERQEYLGEAARSVMRDLFEELLILSRADQLAITVTAAEVTEALGRMRESNGLQDDEEFRKALAQSGITPEQLRAQFEQQMRSQRVVGREVYSEVKLEEEDLRRYYREHVEDFRQPEQVKLREVVVLDDTGASAAAMTRGLALVGWLREGEALEKVVADQPAGTVSSVIELGWVESGDLDAALEDAVWTLEPGSWSEPTRARGGVHVAQVIERRESVIPEFKDVEGEIREREERSRLNERMKTYLAELEKKSYLYLDPPPEAAGFRTASGETPGNVEFPLVPPTPEGEGGKNAEKRAAKAAKAAAAAGGPDAVEATLEEEAAAEAATEAGEAEVATEEAEAADSEAADTEAEAEAEEERQIERELRQEHEEEIDLRPIPDDPEGPDGVPPPPPPA
jgi:parvulin-like peptidyl-prolyl isomerase